jgi:hypothetical protein
MSWLLCIKLFKERADAVVEVSQLMTMKNLLPPSGNTAVVIMLIKLQDQLECIRRVTLANTFDDSWAAMECAVVDLCMFSKVCHV